MSKQRRKRRLEPPVPAKFKIGDRVRVKPGILDEDHPDIPLGGWAGTISEVHKRGIYSVRWSQETLASIHPIYKKRSTIDGNVLEEYWLGEDDMEPDPGGPLAIEQPTRITPRPLSAEDQSDRVRMVFGVTSDDLLPAVDEDSLETYYDHLAEQMKLPVDARHCPQEDFLNPSPLRRVKIVALDGEIGWDEDEGILCKIRTDEGEKVVPLTDIEFRHSEPNYQLLADYSAWFCGHLLNEDEEDDVAEKDDEIEDDGEASEVPKSATWRDVVLVLLEIVAFAMSFSAVVGSAVAVMPWARWAGCIGGGVWGMIVAVAHVRYARKEMSFVVPRLQKVADGVIGVLTGIVHGALFGIMAVAFIGAVLGGIVGVILRRLVRGREWMVLRVFPSGILFPAACGVIVQAFYMDRAAAITGLEYGALIGLGSGLFLCLVALPFATIAVRSPSR